MFPSWRWYVLGLVGIAAVGCGDPGEIVPVGPPGVEFVRVPPALKEGEGAQALGEQAAASAAADPNAKAPEVVYDAPPTKVGVPASNATGLEYTTLVEGNGPAARAGMTATMHYKGTLDDGTVFDTSVGRAPFSFKLGSGQVIKGWEMGIPGMLIGEKRKLVIPGSLAYGPKGQGKIPPDATLTFEIELLKVE